MDTTSNRAVVEDMSSKSYNQAGQAFRYGAGESSERDTYPHTHRHAVSKRRGERGRGERESTRTTEGGRLKISDGTVCGYRFLCMIGDPAVHCE